MSGYKEGFTTSMNLEDLITHEMGHSLVYAKAECGGVPQLMDFREILQETAGLEGISKYAEYNLSESMAEAFVKYYKGEKLPTEALGYLQKYMGVK